MAAITVSARAIELARLRKGLSPADLAAAVGISEGQLRRIRAGQIRRPHTETLHRLATVLDVDIAELLEAEVAS
jgi:transcriptional regulator with XRE-family HTH domain